jgi:hypothetical protein
LGLSSPGVVVKREDRAVGGERAVSGRNVAAFATASFARLAVAFDG